MWNKRWLILRRSPARLEKYETEAAASFQASSHCAFYDLSRLQVIERLTDRPGICVVLADFTNLHIATDSGTVALLPTLASFSVAYQNLTGRVW